MGRNFELSEQMRRQASAFLFGEVAEAFPGGWYIVKTDDGMKTGRIPGLRPNGEGNVFFSSLKVGEQVLLLVPHGDLSLAVIAGSIPRLATVKEQPLTEGRWAFPDGTAISYDTATKELKIKAAGGAKVTIDAPGGIEVIGEMKVSGGISGGDLKIDGKVTATGEISAPDVKAGSVSLKSHTHGGVQGGNGTSQFPTGGSPG